MSAELDAAYRAQRLRLASVVEEAASRTWAHLYQDRDAATAAVMQIVAAGQAHTVVLVDAYMSAKLGVSPKGLDASKYTTEALRGQSPEEVYSRPFGAFGASLNRTAEA